VSDFDDVLERLLTDAVFKARLAADPGGALAGYRLSSDEIDLLRSQLSADEGGQHSVEQRTSKASLFGLLGGFGGGFGGLHDAAAHAGGATDGGSAGMGDAMPRHLAPGQGGEGPLGRNLLGHQMPSEDAPTAHWQPDPPNQSGQYGQSGLGSADQSGQSGLSSADQSGQSGIGSSDQYGQSGLGSADPGVAQPTGGGGPAPVGDYQARVDVDGDGKWDAHTYQARDDGGVDIVVDSNHDGRADFIGVDHDRDGLIDESYVDHDHDGVADAHYVDDNGDGWLDHKAPLDRSHGTVYMSRNTDADQP
jgi:hypothetical protein